MRVLVADDSKAMRMIVIRTLRQSGLHVDEIREATDGAEALGMVDEYQPNLILSDWNMPNMTGIQFLTALREQGNSTTFGFITSESSSSMREEALAAGAQFLLVKPFDADRLADLVGSSVS